MALGNHTVRILVALIAIPLIIFICSAGKLFFFFFVLIISLLSYYEFFLMAKNKNISVNLALGLFGIIFLIINQYSPLISLYSFLLFFIALIFLIELFRNKGSAIQNIGATLLGVFYLGLFGSSIVGIREFYPDIGDLYSRGGFLMISIFASIWICDSAAFWAGSSMGKHKLFPRISPNKSWEGSVFGFFSAVLIMIFAQIIILDFITLKDAVILGIIIGSAGQFGDLIESLLKRNAGVKDSSKIIPGHGGVFDRFDSLFYVSPLILLYLTYFGR